MTDHEAIRDVMTRYCWHVDHAEWDSWLALFTLDASWGARGERAFEGRDAMMKLTNGLAKKYDPATSARHFTANLLIDLAGDRARLRTYLMTIQPSKEIVRLGEYDIDLVRRDGKWLMRRLEFSPSGAA